MDADLLLKLSDVFLAEAEEMALRAMTAEALMEADRLEGIADELRLRAAMETEMTKVDDLRKQREEAAERREREAKKRAAIAKKVEKPSERATIPDSPKTS